MYKRTTDRVNSPSSRPFPVPDSSQSQAKRANIGNFAQGIITCAALFAGILWVIGMKPHEEQATPIRVDSWDHKPEVLRGERREESLTIFLVATEEDAKRIYEAFGGNEGNAEIAALGNPMFRYEIVVTPSQETNAAIGYRYAADADSSSPVAEPAAQVIDLRVTNR